jgi:multisubunit Na+/H+ antiporter MnhG subunit
MRIIVHASTMVVTFPASIIMAAFSPLPFLSGGTSTYTAAVTLAVLLTSPVAVAARVAIDSGGDPDIIMMDHAGTNDAGSGRILSAMEGGTTATTHQACGSRC